MMKMDKYIQELLDRFMAGTSSTKEEKELGEYFRTHEVKPEWEPFKEMFAYFDRGMKRDSIKSKDLNTAEIKPMRERWIFIATAVAIILMITTLTLRNLNIKPDKNAILCKKENTITTDNDSVALQRLSIRNVEIDQNVAKLRKSISYKKIAIKKQTREKIDSVRLQEIDEDIKVSNVLLQTAQKEDSTDLKIINDEIETSNNILQTAQDQNQEYLDKLGQDIKESERLIEIAYTVSYLNFYQIHQPKIQTVLISPSESLDKTVASYTTNIIYK
jgi:hypothetical protein